MHLSVREVIELAERSFAAAGFSDGNSRAYARAVWWAEAYRGSGVSTLHELLDDLPELASSEMTMSGGSSTVPVIEAHAQPSLIASEPALNLCCAEADRRGIGITAAMTGTPDRSLDVLGHVAYRAVERGYDAIVLYADDDDGSRTVLGTSGEPHPLVADAKLTDPSESFRRLMRVVDRELQTTRDSPLFQSFFAENEETVTGTTDDARLLDRVLNGSIEPSGVDADGTGPGFVVLYIDRDHPRISHEAGRVVERFIEERESELTDVFRPESVHERAETLIADGVDVDEDVWRELFEFSNGVLAPPFEGSEKGAGFDLNDLD